MSWLSVSPQGVPVASVMTLGIAHWPPAPVQPGGAGGCGGHWNASPQTSAKPFALAMAASGSPSQLAALPPEP